MITFKEARQIAEAELNIFKASSGEICCIIAGAIIEKEYAWIFPYNWTQKQISDFKKNATAPIEYGSKTRLTEIQKTLHSRGIQSNLTIIE